MCGPRAVESASRVETVDPLVVGIVEEGGVSAVVADVLSSWGEAGRWIVNTAAGAVDGDGASRRNDHS